MKDGGILSTMTYYGSQMVVENYNIMRPVKAALDRRPAISLPNWPGGLVASTSHEVNIVESKPRPTLRPVSNRLKKTLAHSHRGRKDTSIVENSILPGWKTNHCR